MIYLDWLASKNTHKLRNSDSSSSSGSDRGEDPFLLVGSLILTLTLSRHPINTPYQYTLTTHPIISTHTHLLNKPSHTLTYL